MPRDMTKARQAAAAARAKKAAEAKPAEPFNGADTAKFDHDGKGGPGGSLPKAATAEERAAAQAQAAADAERAQAQREAVERGEQKREPVSGPSVRAKTQIALAEAADLRNRAARQAVDAVERGDAEPMVVCRITKQGDGKVSMGKHFAGIGEAHYEWKEAPTFPLSVARALEERGFVEIEEE